MSQDQLQHEGGQIVQRHATRKITPRSKKEPCNMCIVQDPGPKHRCFKVQAFNNKKQACSATRRQGSSCSVFHRNCKIANSRRDRNKMMCTGRAPRLQYTDARNFSIQLASQEIQEFPPRPTKSCCCGAPSPTCNTAVPKCKKNLKNAVARPCRVKYATQMHGKTTGERISPRSNKTHPLAASGSKLQNETGQTYESSLQLPGCWLHPHNNLSHVVALSSQLNTEA